MTMYLEDGFILAVTLMLSERRLTMKHKGHHHDFVVMVIFF